MWNKKKEANRIHIFCQDEENREEEKRKHAKAKRLAKMDELQKGKEANRMRIIHQNEKKREEEKRKDAEAMEQ